jgi:hypothetical protein
MCYRTARMIYALSICPGAFWRATAARREARPPTSPMGSANLAQPASAEAMTDRSGPVKPSPTQSHLVKPSPTFNFPLSRGASTRVTRSIRAICGIRGWKSFPIRADLCAFVAAPICVHPCASVAPAQSAFAGPMADRSAFARPAAASPPTQYGLIRPNTALNYFMRPASMTFCQSGEAKFAGSSLELHFSPGFPTFRGQGGPLKYV